MPVLTPPSTLDVGRFIRPSTEEIVELLLAYYTEMPAWTYGPARAVARSVFSGEISLKAAVHGCETRGSLLGRPWNAEVAKLVWEAGRDRSLKCFKLSKRKFAIRQDLSFSVDPLFFFVEEGKIKIFWLQPRSGFNPTVKGLGIIATILRMTFADDFENFDLELLDLSRPKGTKIRVPKTYTFSDLPLLPEEEVRLGLSRFAEAYDIVSARGVQRPERRVRPQDDRQLRFPE